MKTKSIFMILLLFSIISCTKNDELLVKDFKYNDVNILESKKEKIIIVTRQLVCHSCIMNLNDYIADNYDLKKYDYYLLTEDLENILGRRITLESYKNEYAPNIKKIFFSAEDSIVQKRLKIPKKVFKQATPYIVYIGFNKKPVYHPYKEIFDSTGHVKESFRTKKLWKTYS